MIQVIFLIVLALVWIIFATIQDLRTREIANWLSFSLIIFAIGFRFFYSVFSETGFEFFYEGLIGLGIFFIIGNLLYYGKIFAGGDTKLMIALGAILPFSLNFLDNIKIFILFFILFFLAGSVYGLIYSLTLMSRNFSRFKLEFKKVFRNYKDKIYFIMFVALFFMAFGFSQKEFFYLGVFIFIMPYFYVYARSVDESCMIKKLKAKYLREGDWLYEDIKIGKKTIKADWAGISDKNIKLLKTKFKNKKILVRQGIPFTPVFLITFIILVWIWFSDKGLGLFGSFGSLF